MDNSYFGEWSNILVLYQQFQFLAFHKTFIIWHQTKKTKNAKIISGMLCQQDRANHHSTQAVEMSVTVNNSPIQAYLHLDNYA